MSTAELVLFLMVQVSLIGSPAAEARPESSTRRPDVARFVGVKGGEPTQAMKKIKSFSDVPALDAYFLKDGNIDTFYADADRASWKNYASFREFLTVLKFNELEGRFGEHAMGSFFGDVFLPAGSSCIVTESTLFQPPKMIAMMKYHSVLLALDSDGNRVLSEYVDALSDSRFFERPVKFERPEKIQCRWGIYIFEKDVNTAYAEYLTLEANRQAIYREFSRLETAFKESPRGEAVAKFLANTDLPQEAQKSVAEHAARANEISLGCVMNFVMGSRTFPTFLGEEAGFTCSGDACASSTAKLRSSTK